MGVVRSWMVTGFTWRSWLVYVAELLRVERRGDLLEAVLVDPAPPVGAVEGAGFDVAYQGADVVDFGGAQAVPVLVVYQEQAGQAAFVHQFAGGGRLRVLDVEVLEPLPEQVDGLLRREGG